MRGFLAQVMSGSVQNAKALSGIDRKGHRRRLRIPGSHKKIFPHVLIAERVLGHSLSLSAKVHHYPSLPSTQLVICQNQTYHLLLHQRERARVACGHPSWRYCWICKTWDNPKNLHVRPKKVAYHLKCQRNRYAQKGNYYRKYQRELYARNREYHLKCQRERYARRKLNSSGVNCSSYGVSSTPTM